MLSLPTPKGRALIQPSYLPWPVLAAEAKMRAETSPWWVPGTQVHEIPVGEGVVWVAELPDGSQRALSLTGSIPSHILALLRAGIPLV